jgi:hypothetical protein
MGWLWLLLFAAGLVAHASAGSLGNFTALTSVSVSNTSTGCSIRSNELRVTKASTADQNTVILLKFDIAQLLQQEQQPEVAVLHLFSSSVPQEQVLVGRLEATVVGSDWSNADLECAQLPLALEKFKSPPKYISGLAGEDLTINLETVIHDLLLDNITSISLLIAPEDVATIVDLSFDAAGTTTIGNSTFFVGPMLEYYVPTGNDLGNQYFFTVTKHSSCLNR